MEGSPCDHYVDLTYKSGDDLPHTIQSCESTPTLWFEGWEELLGTDETSTHIVEFYENPWDSDICMFYNNKLHVCSSYRYHFYEHFVHFAAQYIEKVERVLIIGGNSMALHEVLKSDDLELVAVLGRDPQTPHKSFLDFETQPHFDDDRLEWWFGDFAQTLSVLPEEYLSSFDLVLVEEIPGVEYRLSRIVQRLC
jgi:predicted membrane-bound spermidine synthase